MIIWNKISLVCQILGYPDTSKPYVLYTDASDKAIVACLVQEVENNNQIGPDVKNEKPIYFLSHKLSETQQRWYTVENIMRYKN